MSRHSRRLLPTGQSPVQADSSGRGIYLQLCHFRAAPQCSWPRPHVCAPQDYSPRVSCLRASDPMIGFFRAQGFIQNIVYLMTGGFA